MAQLIDKFALISIDSLAVGVSGVSTTYISRSYRLHVDEKKINQGFHAGPRSDGEDTRSWGTTSCISFQTVPSTVKVSFERACGHGEGSRR